MIKLIKLNALRYVVVCSAYDVYHIGDMHEAVNALRYCDISDEEISFAFDELTLKNHNAAEFGINKTFIFTSECPISSSLAS